MRIIIEYYLEVEEYTLESGEDTGSSIEKIEEQLKLVIISLFQERNYLIKGIEEQILDLIRQFINGGIE
ncbi:MAG: hypothetical protein MTP17_02025 [Candidatus Midichloria sp.]|nr:MAG: hypothetical protein MTP17_02025 [Candidatus Midichloria sp.]